jgi:hypothetical protein
MAKEIVTFKTKADLNDVILRGIYGEDRKYILSPHPKSKLERLVNLASAISNSNKSSCLLEVQFTYGKRAKRLEVVSILDTTISIYKLSKKTSIDKDALELDQVISSIQTHFNDFKYNFTGCLVLKELPSSNVINSVKKILSNQIDFVQTDAF